MNLTGYCGRSAHKIYTKQQIQKNCYKSTKEVILHYIDVFANMRKRLYAELVQETMTCSCI